MNILIICSGSMGHYYGIKQFFEYTGLKDEHKILYAFHGFPKDKAENNPSCYPLNSFPAFLNYEFRFTKKTKEVLQLKQHNVLLKKRVETFRALFDDFPPDVILLDTHAFTDGFLLKQEFPRMECKVLFFQTRLSTELGKESVYGSHVYNRFEWLSARKILWRQKLHRFKYRLMMPGFSKYRQLDKYTKEVDLELNKHRFRLPSIKDIPELLLSGTRLSRFQTINQHYMGLCISPKWSTSRITKQKRILVSGGSVTNKLRYLPKYNTIINRLIQLLPEFKFIIPEGMKVENQHSNFTSYTWDEYQDALSRAHIHITHGGINSIKDSLSYGVPTLICPLDWDGDQIHNALFFEELELSLTWIILRDSIEEVAGKLRELTKDGYCEKIQKFVLKGNADYPPEKAKEKFLELTNDDRWEVRNW